jgi:hypothetical protein
MYLITIAYVLPGAVGIIGGLYGFYRYRERENTREQMEHLLRSIKLENYEMY